MKVKKDHAQMKPGSGEKAQTGESSARTWDRHVERSDVHFDSNVF